MGKIHLSFKDNSEHAEAYNYLSKLGRSKTDFVVSLICRYLKDNNISTSISEKDAKNIAIGYMSKPFGSPSTTPVNEPSTPPIVEEPPVEEEPMVNKNLLSSLEAFY